MTRIRRASAITQHLVCVKTRRKRTHKVNQFIRTKLKLEGRLLKRRAAQSDVEQLFGRVA